MKKNLAISVTISIIIFLLFIMGIFKVFDNYIYDNLQKNIDPGKPVNKFIVIIAIDDFSLSKFGIWPLPRNKYAKLTKILTQGGAKVIAFDINFDSYSGYSHDEDIEFANILDKTKNVILARDYYMERGKPVIRDPINELKENTHLAMVTPIMDKDSFVRRYKLLAYHEKETLLYFATQTIMLYNDIAIDKLRIANRQLLLDNIQIPLDKEGLLNINYFSTDKGISIVPFEQALRPEFLELNPDFFQDKIVLIGATASYLQDNFSTPVGLNLPGVLIHANAIRTILNKEFIKTLPALYYLLFIIFIFVSVNLATVTKGSFPGFIFSCFLIIIITYTGRYLYSLGLYIESFVLLFSSLISYLSGVFVNFLNIKDEKSKIKNIFNQYVSPNIVERFISGEEDLAEKGKERLVSVLFVDVVGFTGLCEKLPPIKVVAQLNEILDVLTEEVFKHQGTLDKFIGDELMAVWGSPVEQANHAQLAVACSMSMIRSINNLNQKWEKEGKPILKVGISISSGKVIAGNIGAKKHKDYTVIGDAVNIASRLQSITRKGYDIVIEETTKELIKNDNYLVKKIDDILVKGKKKKVSAWTIC